VFDDLYFVDLVHICLVLCLPRFIIVLCFFLLALVLILSVLVERLPGKSISDMTYLVSSGTLNLSQSIN